MPSLLSMSLNYSLIKMKKYEDNQKLKYKCINKACTTMISTPQSYCFSCKQVLKFEELM